MIPVHLRVIGPGEDLEHPTRPRLHFAGEVRDGQTMSGFVEMTPEDHLRWKWVRLRSIMVYAIRIKKIPTNVPGMRRIGADPLEVISVPPFLTFE